MILSKHRLRDLVDADNLQKLLDNLHLITGIPAVLVDNDETIIARSTWTKICDRFHRTNSLAESRCLQSKRCILDNIQLGAKYFVNQCGNGLIDIGVPIKINGLYMAAIFQGQFLFAPPSLDQFATRAEQLGFDREEYLTAVKEVPVVPAEKVKLYIGFLTQLGETIAEMGLARIQELQMKKQLQLSEERFSLALEGSGIGVWDRDFRDDSAFFFKGGQAIAGFDPKKGSFTHEDWIETIHPDDKEQVMQALQKNISGETNAYAMEYRLRVEKGYKWVLSKGRVTARSADGQPLRMVGTFSDITERKTAEKALKDSENLLSLIYNAASDIIFLMAVEDNGCYRYVSVNKAYIETTGLTGQDILGKRLEEILSSPDSKPMVKRFQQVIADKRPIQYESLITSFGQKVITHTTLSPVLDENDNCSHILGVARNITEWRRMEREMRRLDRLNLVGEMAASIAHEIRNPLTTVLGFLQLFKYRNKFPEDQEYFDLMREELKRANTIITDFLSLAKGKTVHFESCNLNTIVADLSKLLNADVISKEKSLVQQLGTIPNLLLDKKEIRQLLLNLIFNGLEAMPPGGTLTVKTFVEKEKVVLAVQDEGPGISADLLDRLGTPFLTTKENGTGLGLAVCYSIAARHNTTIDVDTGPAGTTFCVRFPINTEF